MTPGSTYNTGAQAAILAFIEERGHLGASRAEMDASPARHKHLGTYLLRLLRLGLAGYVVEPRPVGRGRPPWRYFAAQHCPPGATIAQRPAPKAPSVKAAPAPRPPKPQRVPKPPKPPKAAKPAPAPKATPAKQAKATKAQKLAAVPTKPNNATIKRQTTPSPSQSFAAATPRITERTKVTIWTPQPDPRAAKIPPAPPLFGKLSTGRAPEPRAWAAAVAGGGR